MFFFVVEGIWKIVFKLTIITQIYKKSTIFFVDKSTKKYI